MQPADLIEKHLESIIDFRHRLHQIPELGFCEIKTAAAIRAELDRLAIEYAIGPADAPTATIAWIGDKTKPCVALRADIDALPIPERRKSDYISTHDSCMHACGHDGHMSILAGAAAVLREIADQLPCCVKFIFQPAEEGGGGAEKLVSAGVLDGRIGPKVSAIFGLHGWPDLPVGMIATKPGPLLAATDSFVATFRGKGCHAAFPHFGRDPIAPACEVVLNLQQIITREIDPTEPAALSVTQIHAGTTHNVIPDTARIEGTARTLNESTRALIEKSFRRRCESIAAASKCEVQIDWERGYPATINDPKMTQYVIDVAKRTLGEDRFIPAARAAMGGEDFAYYLEKIPGCFFLVGVKPHDCENYPSLHSDQFDFTDAAIPVGVRMFVELVRGFGA